MVVEKPTASTTDVFPGDVVPVSLSDPGLHLTPEEQRTIRKWLGYLRGEAGLSDEQVAEMNRDHDGLSESARQVWDAVFADELKIKD
ncbi:MAG: hypothetical protein K1X87_05875 [Dehalococcoidia bacterium]|nr:hypothetical protein [Dehalococcoidia bacterium]